MPRLRILFADDQIPDERHWGLTESEMISALKREHPEWTNPNFVPGFPQMRLAVQKLQSAGYDITLARKYQEAIQLIQRNLFDIAIVDLRWDADETLTQMQSDSAGWSICDAIEKANKELDRRTLQIVYSSRFNEDPVIAMQAADLNKLPVYKSYNEAGGASLLAAVKFIDGLIGQRKPTMAEDLAVKLQQVMMQYLETPIRQQQRFFSLLLIFLGLSAVLIIVGAGLVILGNEQLIGTLNSLASLLIATVSVKLYRMLEKRDKVLTSSLNEIKEQFRDAIGRAEHTSRASAV